MLALHARSDGIQLRTVRLHGAADVLRARQRMEASVADVTPSTLRLPERAVLILRRLAPAARLRLDPAARADAFKTAVRAGIEQGAGRARRPWLDPDGATADAVLFADATELMACLLRDWLRGALRELWWAASVLGGVPAPEWWRREVIPRGDALPAVLSLLSAQGYAVAWVLRLSEGEAVQSTAAIAAAHAMPLGPEASRSGSDATALIAEQPRVDSVRWEERALDGVISGARKRLLAIIPELQTAALTVTQRRLLAIGLGLQRASAWTRRPDFAAALRFLDKEPPAPRGRDEGVAAAEETRRDDATAPPAPPARDSFSRAAQPPRGNPLLRRPLPVPRTVRRDDHGPGQPGNEAGGSVRAADPAAPVLEAPESLTPFAHNARVAGASSPLDLAVEALAVAAAAPSQGLPVAALPPVWRDPSSQPRQAVKTKFGGVFYLLNVALALGLYGDFTQPRRQGLALSPWDWLALIGRAWLGRDFERDPLWGLLAQLAGRSSSEAPGAEFPAPEGWSAPSDWLEPWGKVKRLRAYASRDRLQLWHDAGFVVIEAARDPEAPPLAQAGRLCAQHDPLREVGLQRVYRLPRNLARRPGGGVGAVRKKFHSDPGPNSPPPHWGEGGDPLLSDGEGEGALPPRNRKRILLSHLDRPVTFPLTPALSPERSGGTAPLSWTESEFRIGHARLMRWLQLLLLYLDARLVRGLGVDDLAALPGLVCRHEAELFLTPAALDVHLSLAALPIELRIAGLDRDPGWIPAAGRTLAFRFG